VGLLQICNGFGMKTAHGPDADDDDADRSITRFSRHGLSSWAGADRWRGRTIAETPHIRPPQSRHEGLLLSATHIAVFWAASRARRSAYGAVSNVTSPLL